MNMVGVQMGEPYRVHAGGPRSQQLQPKLGGSIDEKRSMVQLQEGTVPCALVPGVRGRARLAVAPHYGNPEGCAGAKEGELHELEPLEAHGVRRT